MFWTMNCNVMLERSMLFALVMKIAAPVLTICCVKAGKSFGSREPKVTLEDLVK